MMFYGRSTRWSTRDSLCPACRGTGNVLMPLSDKEYATRQAAHRSVSHLALRSCGPCGGGGFVAVRFTEVRS